MGKWYNHKSLIQYKADIAIDRGSKLESILPHVEGVARAFPQDSIAIGALDLNDLIQAGNIGLVEAWDKVNWDQIETSPNPQAELWTFLKNRIKWSIRREIDNYGAFISVPNSKLEAARRDLNYKTPDKILVNMFPNFFDEELRVNDDYASWDSLQLEIIIEDYLRNHVKSIDHIDLFLSSWGIGRVKMSGKELAEKYMLTHGNVRKIAERISNKLRTKEFSEIIENYYKN